MTLHTTFSLLKQYDACVEGYTKLAEHLGGVRKYGEDTPIPIVTILESNNVQDATWSLRAVLPEQEVERDRLARHYAADCAEHVLHYYEDRYPGDTRLPAVLTAVYRFVEGNATVEELAQTRVLARSIRAAAGAAWAAAAAAEEAAEEIVRSPSERVWQTQRFRELFS